MSVFGGRCNFKGHKGQYLRVAGGLPVPWGSYWGTGCGGYCYGRLTHDVGVSSRVRGTCLRAKGGYRLRLTWNSFISHWSFCTSQSRGCRSTIIYIGFVTANIREFKCGHRWHTSEGVGDRGGPIPGHNVGGPQCASQEGCEIPVHHTMVGPQHRTEGT